MSTTLPELSGAGNLDAGLNAPKAAVQLSAAPEIADELTIQKRLMRLTTGITEIEALFPTIRLNQLKGLQDLKEFLAAGETNGYFRMPTGAGKTILFALISKMLDEKTLILVPNKNLLKSTPKDFASLGYDPATIGMVGGGHNQEAQFTVMTYQTFLNRGAPKGTTLVVCDEVHRSLGEKTRAKIDETVAGLLDADNDGITDKEEESEDQVLLALKGIGKQLILGFTATDQLGAKAVSEIHGKLISSTSYAELIRAGILKKVQVHQVEGEIDEDAESGHFTLEDEDKALAESKTHERMLEAYMEFKADFKDYPLRPAVFCNSIENTERFAALAAEYGLKCEVVTGQGGDLDEAERKLFAGETDFIVTVDKLKEGWDFPALNTVLWLRATSSPANLIQGVGRSMRSYKDESRAHLFETDWRVSKKRGVKNPNDPSGPKNPSAGTLGSGKKASSKALTLAQALSDLGEDVGLVLENADDLEHTHYYDLNEDGIAEVEGVGMVCGLNSYSQSGKVSPGALVKWVEECGRSPLEGVRGKRGSMNVALYLKSDVDAVIDLKRRGSFVDLNDDGIAEVEKVGTVCGLKAYSRARNVNPSTLVKWVEECGRSPLEGARGKRGSMNVALYLKSEVDAVIDLKRRGSFVDLNKDGTAEVGKVGTVCGLTPYSRSRKLDPSTLVKWIEECGGLSVLDGIRGKAYTCDVPLYLKSDVDAVIDLKRSGSFVDLNKDGIAEVEEVGTVCGLVGYSQARNVSPLTLAKWVGECGLSPLEGVRGKRSSMNVALYLKSEVDAVIDLKRSGLLVDLNEDGIAEVEKVGTVCGLKAYSRSRKLDPSALVRWIEECGRSPLEGVRGKVRTRDVALYLKSEVDAVIDLKRSGLFVGLNEDGIAELEKIGIVCGLNAYSRGKKVSDITLMKWVEECGLSPLKGVRGKRGARDCALYLKSDIDALLASRGR